MKSNIKKLLLLFLFSLITLGCSKDDKPETLPEATQTGRGIFACYVDGKPFIDTSGVPNGISFNCFYQLIDGEYYFGIQGRSNENLPKSISLGSLKKEIIEGQTYNLIQQSNGNFSAGLFYVYSPTEYYNALTSNINTGILQVTKFDLQNQIISGTFSFNITHPMTNQTVKITEGRFDTHFGQ